jgi:60kDa lysophospholipase
MGGNDSDSNKSSGGSGMFRLNQRLLSKEVQDKIN